MLLVKKKGVNMRQKMDYSQLKKVTIRNWCHTPIMNNLMDQLLRARMFSKIGRRSSYHQIQVKTKDVSKTMFRTRYDHHKYSIIPFSVSNTTRVFMEYMNRIFHSYLDHFVVVVIDDILVYSQSDEEHAEHL